MAKWPKSAAMFLTGSGVVTTHPAWLHGVSVCTDTAGNGVSVYEGQDATSGRQLLHLESSANITNTHYLNPPVWCERGLYVAFDSNVNHVTVHYTPQSLNQPTGE